MAWKYRLLPISHSDHFLYRKYYSFKAFLAWGGEAEAIARSERRNRMDEKQLKKLLAGLCITGLLSGSGLACAQQGQSS